MAVTLKPLDTLDHVENVAMRIEADGIAELTDSGLLCFDGEG